MTHLLPLAVLLTLELLAPLNALPLLTNGLPHGLSDLTSTCTASAVGIS
jgi:hypothetical protein